jgi:chromosomal replication initiation ATPase DnaA
MGLSAELQPDYETRISILKNFVSDGVEIPEEIIGSTQHQIECS